MASTSPTDDTLVQSTIKISPPSQTPFRFLDLPRDIRFMVYDCIPIVTRHHLVTAVSSYPYPPAYYALKIVSYRIPGISLLSVCRFINTDAILLQRRIAAVNNSPLRLIADWHSVDGAAIRATLLCASEQPCTTGRHLRILLNSRINGPEGLMQRDFDTHEELHDIIRRSETNTRPRAVEIAVVRDIKDPRYGSLDFRVFDLYDWVGVHGGRQGERELEITFRLFTEACEGLSMHQNPFLDEEHPEQCWQGKKWGCKVREGVGEKEKMTWWEEGEK
jgi:hypothetical protein